jgi:hypothetical protein
MVFTAKVSNPACGGAGAGDERVKRGRKERRERTGRRIVGRAGWLQLVKKVMFSREFGEATVFQYREKIKIKENGGTYLFLHFYFVLEIGWRDGRAVPHTW